MKVTIESEVLKVTIEADNVDTADGVFEMCMKAMEGVGYTADDIMSSMLTRPSGISGE